MARSRFFRLAGMTGDVARRYAGHRLRQAMGMASSESELYETIGRRLAETLGELKGPIMKMGQVAAQMEDLLPREITETLKSLQRNAPPRPYAEIASQVRAELGAAPEQVFASFDERAFAAASIGQVHRARSHDGRELVVKVQYPGLDEALESDLRHLRRAIRVGRLARVPARALDQLFDEMRLRLREELDYRCEANAAEAFAALYSDEPVVRVPQVVPELSTSRVLTLEYLPGDDLAAAARYSQDARNRIGENLFRLFAEQVFKHRLLHADPHPGNFAYAPDGTITLYDFGCVKRLDADVVDLYRDVLRAGFEGRFEEMDQDLLALGLRVPCTPPPEPGYYQRWREILVPTLGCEGPYDFAAEQAHRQASGMVRDSFKYLGSFQPAAELALVDRVILGHYWTLVSLGVRASFWSIVESLLYDDEAARPRAD